MILQNRACCLHQNTDSELKKKHANASPGSNIGESCTNQHSKLAAKKVVHNTNWPGQTNITEITSSGTVTTVRAAAAIAADPWTGADQQSGPGRRLSWQVLSKPFVSYHAHWWSESMVQRGKVGTANLHLLGLCEASILTQPCTHRQMLAI